MILTALLNNVPVGTLALDSASGRFSFTYDEAWRRRESPYTLCPALPLLPPAGETPDQHSAAVRQFFQNLLPEGRALDDAAGVNGLSKGNVIGLLHALGRETAGALRLVVPEAAGKAGAQKRLLTKEELSARIRERPELSFTVWDGKVRLSIAGYQDKLAVYQEGGDWYLVDSPTLASTHIVKPEPVSRMLAGMTSNEFFCMRLAATAGLATAKVELRQLPEPVLVIERFDRIVAKNPGAEVGRRHCIDGCQALGLPVDYKYERPFGDGRDVAAIRDGASLPKFFSLMSGPSFAAPAANKLRLLQWQIFQVLIGNTDAHAKNISLFSGPAGLSLAPGYDLVCGLVYDAQHIESSLAMAIGDNFDPRTIGALDWAQMAFECELPPSLVARELQRLAMRVDITLPGVIEEARQSGADMAVVERITQLVLLNCARAKDCAPSLTKIDPALF